MLLVERRTRVAMLRFLLTRRLKSVPSAAITAEEHTLHRAPAVRTRGAVRRPGSTRRPLTRQMRAAIVICETVLAR